MTCYRRRWPVPDLPLRRQIGHGDVKVGLPALEGLPRRAPQSVPVTQKDPPEPDVFPKLVLRNGAAQKGEIPAAIVESKNGQQPHAAAVEHDLQADVANG